MECICCKFLGDKYASQLGSYKKFSITKIVKNLLLMRKTQSNLNLTLRNANCLLAETEFISHMKQFDLHNMKYLIRIDKKKTVMPDLSQQFDYFCLKILRSYSIIPMIFY